MKCHITCTSWLILPLKGSFSILHVLVENIHRTKLNFYQILPFIVTSYPDQYPRMLISENENEGGGSVRDFMI